MPERMGGGPEYGGEKPQNEELVTRLVTQIKEKDLLNPAIVDREQKAAELMTELNFGADSVEELYNTLQDRNKSDTAKEKAQEKIDILGRAVYTALVEDSNPERRELIIAGSFSVESVLPESFSGLGDAVVNNYTDNADIRQALETVDIIKNDPELNQDGFLLDQVKAQKENLSGIKIDFRNKRDLKVRAQATKYLSDLERRLTVEPETDTDEEDEEAEAQRRTPPPQYTQTETGESREYGYGPKRDVFVRKVISGDNTSFRDTSPPTWYENLTRDPVPGRTDRFGKERGAIEQWKIRVVAELASAAGTKTAFKDGNLDDLANKYRPSVAKEEFKLLYETNEQGMGLPGFKDSLEVYMQSLFSFDRNTGFLSLKDLTYTDESGQEKNIYDDFYGYQCDLAEKLLKGTGLFTGRKIEGIRTLEDAKIALGTAWNFLFVGDVVESADEDRLLNPGKAYGDKVAAMFHPEAKFLRKFRLRFPGARPVVGKEQFTGEEEPFGGSYGDWWYNRMKEDKGIFDSVFRGETHPFPKRLAMSFIESFGVYATGDKGQSVEQMSMAQALIEGKTIITGLDQVHDRGGKTYEVIKRDAYGIESRQVKAIGDFEFDYNTDAPMMIRYRDIYQASYGLFNYVMGKVPFDAKARDKWIEGLKTNLALVRQNKIPNVNAYLSHVDDAEFIKIAIANSWGVRSSLTKHLIIDTKDEPEFYYVNIRGITNMSNLITGPNRDKIIKQLQKEFSGSSMLEGVKAIKEAERDLRKKNSYRII
jgi:hypothetical protein